MTALNLSSRALRVIGRHVSFSNQQVSSRSLSTARKLKTPSVNSKVSKGSNDVRSPVPTTTKLEIADPSVEPTVPAYRVLNIDGSLECPLDSSLSSDKILELYEGMLTLNTMERIMYDSQRQGRISFFMTSFGEEAVQFGSASALEPTDWVFAQYREAGVLIYRKMALKLMMAQCYGNKEDLGKGRQMPIHYGNRGLNYVTISSPLATQLPQAVGSAYALKRDQSGRIVCCYFGEGASSEGDAHAAMNFAATLDCPVVFLCRNNGYAISTPASEQFRSDGVVTRAAGYGMRSIRVDGNDLIAVHLATKAAREVCSREHKPVLIEAMTYRVGHHSTSDDSSAYRSIDEVKHYEQNDSPMKRVYNYLLKVGIWSQDREKNAREEARAKVIEAFNWAEKLKKLPIESMFEDVYDEMPANLRRQREELRKHLEEFGDKYPMGEFET